MYEEFKDKLLTMFPNSAIATFEKNTDVESNSIYYEENNRFFFDLVGDKNDWRYKSVSIGEHGEWGNKPIVIECTNHDNNLYFKKFCLRTIPTHKTNYAYEYIDIDYKNKNVDEILHDLYIQINKAKDILSFDVGIDRPDRDYFIKKYIDTIQLQNIGINNECINNDKAICDNNNWDYEVHYIDELKDKSLLEHVEGVIKQSTTVAPNVNLSIESLARECNEDCGTIEDLTKDGSFATLDRQ